MDISLADQFLACLLIDPRSCGVGHVVFPVADLPLAIELVGPFFVEDLENSPHKDDPELPAIQAKFRPILEELVEDYGVEFRMCVVGMERQGLTADLLYSFVEAEKSQPIYLTDYQADGYGYLPLH